MQESPNLNPSAATDWVVLGVSDAAVDCINSILLAQNAHKHWNTDGFRVASSSSATKAVLPRIEVGKRLVQVEGGVMNVA